MVTGVFLKICLQWLDLSDRFCPLLWALPTRMSMKKVGTDCLSPADSRPVTGLCFEGKESVKSTLALPFLLSLEPCSLFIFVVCAFSWYSVRERERARAGVSKYSRHWVTNTFMMKPKPMNKSEPDACGVQFPSTQRSQYIQAKDCVVCTWWGRKETVGYLLTIQPQQFFTHWQTFYGSQPLMDKPVIGDGQQPPQWQQTKKQ